MIELAVGAVLGFAAAVPAILSFRTQRNDAVRETAIERERVNDLLVRLASRDPMEYAAATRVIQPWTDEDLQDEPARLVSDPTGMIVAERPPED